MAPAIMLSTALVAWSLLANLVIGDTLYTTRNLALTAVLVTAVRWLPGRRPVHAGTAEGRPTGSIGPRPGHHSVAEELGISSAAWGSGLRWGAAAAAVVAVVLAMSVVLADTVPGIGVMLADARADVPDRQVAFVTLVRIPIGTALFEEMAFRGTLLAVLLRAGSIRLAVLWSSAAFGLWHIAPAIVTLRVNGVEPTSPGGVGAIAGAVLMTTIAGLLFCWLRLASRSLVAPILAHWATNSLGLLAARSVALLDR